MKTVNSNLIKYLNECLSWHYTCADADPAHGMGHIRYVVRRSLQFAENLDVDINMVYVVAFCHDMGQRVDPKRHEIISAEIVRDDKNLREFFTEEEVNTIADAIEDHRASSGREPRTIYGRIVSSADRNTDADEFLRRCYAWRLKHCPGMSLGDMAEDAFAHAKAKFGVGGYATKTMFFEDQEFDAMLAKLAWLTSNAEVFKDYFCKLVAE